MKHRILLIGVALLLLTMPVLAQSGETYTVQPGDTLADIAAWYDVTTADLMAANGISDPNLIFVGQTLTIPGATATGYYTVQPGDTLADIAAKLGTSVQALASANNLSDVDTIYVGQVLNVPGGGQPTVPAMPVSSCSSNYTVQWGDTLSAIAWRYGVSVEALMNANNLYGGTIYAGQQLCVPGGYMPPAATGYYYTVKAGDTVTNIAARFGVSQWSIVEANNLSDAGFIYVGQKLLIPGYTPPGANPPPANTGDNTASDADGAPDYVPPVQPPDYQDVSQTWDGSVTVVDAENKWVGKQTADFPDPDGNTTIMVRTIDALGVPVVAQMGGMVLHLQTSNSAEFGWGTMGMKGVPAGDYTIWVDQDASDRVNVHLEAGHRILVEFAYHNVTSDPPPRSPTGWSGRVVKNTSGTEPANGVWSTIIVRAGAIGLPVTIVSEGNDFSAMCYTGTKPEYGPGACDFGGLWPGKYTVGIDGAGIAVQVFVDGQGVAEITFDRQ